MNFHNAVLTDKNNQSTVGTDSKLSVASMKVGPSKTKKGNNIQFDAYHGILAPNVTLSVKLTANFLCQETVEEYFEILVKDSDSVFF